MPKPLFEIKCNGCGEPHLTSSHNSKYCPKCAKAKELADARSAYEKKKQADKLKSLKGNNLNRFMKEKAEYEKVTGSYISYGQYMAMRSR